MTDVSIIGMGKLGLPVAVTMSQMGHKVYGYDADDEKMGLYRQSVPASGSHEPGLGRDLGEALLNGLYLCDSVEEALSHEPEIVFVAVPTPSLPDGQFDTSYVKVAIQEVVDNLRVPAVISVISTVLPMTIRGEVATLVGDNPLVYNPSFIAMSSVVRDFKNPEFVMVGTRDGTPNDVVESFYRTIVPQETPILHMTWENAELVKVRYNTYIGFKILIANECMEVCHKIPHADCDVVSNALKMATKRVASGAYFKGGMGDGGECHPRDQRALAWQGLELGLSTNLNDYTTLARATQTEWLATLLREYGLPIVIMGKRFKARSNLTTDSASILLHDILKASGIESWFYDPQIGLTDIPEGPCVFLASIDEDWVNLYPYPPFSVVVDVWRRFKPKEIDLLEEWEVKYVPVGRGQ